MENFQVIPIQVTREAWIRMLQELLWWKTLELST